jgi:alpha-ketoglutarate-dependent 2,4-dichlorophenoxyacetate dioxygenase
MTIQVTPLHPHIGAEVTGVDVAVPLAAETLAALWRAIDERSVLVLKHQSVTDAQLKAFATPFGPLEIGRAALQGGKRRLDIPEIGDISNLDIDSNVRARDDRRRLDMLGNRLWHTDAS